MELLDICVSSDLFGSPISIVLAIYFRLCNRRCWFSFLRCHLYRAEMDVQGFLKATRFLQTCCTLPSRRHMVDWSQLQTPSRQQLSRSVPMADKKTNSAPGGDTVRILPSTIPLFSPLTLHRDSAARGTAMNGRQKPKSANRKNAPRGSCVPKPKLKAKSTMRRQPTMRR